MSKKKDVRIKISSLCVDLLDCGGAEADGDGERTEYTTDGRLTCRGGRMELAYKESAELGMDNSTTTLLFEPDKPELINMVRSGGCTAGLIFNPAVRRQPCAVNVEGMPLQFAIHTRSVRNTLTMNGGAIDLDYIIEFNGCKTERNRFRIEVGDALPVSEP